MVLICVVLLVSYFIGEYADRTNQTFCWLNGLKL